MLINDLKPINLMFNEKNYSHWSNRLGFSLELILKYLLIRSKLNQNDKFTIVCFNTKSSKGKK
jgi:hypothetical protein